MRAWLVVLFALALSTFSRAEQQPDQRPILRIEAGTHTGKIGRIGLSSDGRMLATGSGDKTVRLWTLPEGRLIRTLRLPIDVGNGGKVYAVALSPNGKTVAAGGWDAAFNLEHQNYVYLFDTQSGALARRLGPLPGTVHHLRFSPNGSQLVAGLYEKNGIRVWAAETGRLIGKDTEYGNTVFGADFAADGRLAVASADGRIRLYDAGLKRLKQVKAPGGEQPFAIAFTPQGDKLAVGYDDTTRVDVLSADTLESLHTADTAGVNNGNLFSVAWSRDGIWLFAAGMHYDSNLTNPIFAWNEGGKGRRVAWPGPRDTVLDLLSHPEGGLAFGSHGSSFGLLDETGKRRLAKEPITADMREKLREHFTVSADVHQVRFGLGAGGYDPWLFDIVGLDFAASGAKPPGLHVADTASLPVTNWQDQYDPQLSKTKLKLEQYEWSRSIAVLPNKSGFLHGAEWYLRRFDAKGREVWKRPAPGIAWGVNLSADGRIAVAAYGDGTIRWHRTKDGVELLALFVHREDKRWVLWTPSGYYGASPGGEDLIGWHLNGKSLSDPVDFFPASRFRDQFYRPDIVKLMLATLDEAEAVKQANKVSGRTAEKPFSRKILPPVIGISADVRGLETDAAVIDLNYLLRAPSGREVSKIEVRVDGRLFATETAENLLKPSAKSARSLKVPLPKRDAEVSVVAFHGDQAGEPSRIKVRYTGAPAATAKTTLRALLVGVSAYNNKDLTLNYADNDASDLARVLQEQEGRFFNRVETTVLLDGNASEASIEAALADLAAKTGPDDYAVVFLAGHGLTEKNRFYFVPADANISEGKLADEKTAVAETAILRALSSMRGKVLFFIDACFSAGVIKVDSTGFVNAITSEENAVMMYSSSQGDEVSLEDPAWENGAFTEALMQIFADPKSYNASGEINTDELTGKLKERVRALTQSKQTPVGQSSRAIAPFPVMGL